MTALPVVVSFISVFIAGAALVRTIRSDRKRTLIDLHARFISPEASAQRAALHLAFEQHGPDWHKHVARETQIQINSGMAQLDAMAMQALKRHVPRAEARALWAQAMAVCWLKADRYVQYRKTRHKLGLWVFLERFVKGLDAETRRSIQQVVDIDDPTQMRE